MKSKGPWYPKSKEEFDAYCRAMDEANEAVVQSAMEQARHATAGQQPTPPQNDSQDQESD